MTSNISAFTVENIKDDGPCAANVTPAQQIMPFSIAFFAMNTVQKHLLIRNIGV
jgi:hypothetical protein